jgi:hypothetical protein
MQRNKPEARALQLDRCDVCGDKMHRSRLVRTQVEFLDKKAENFLSYSSYDGTYWVCDAVDEGNVSYGNRCDNVRTTLSDDNDISYINGVQTWSGNVTMRMATISLASAGTSVLVVSAQVGPHEQNTSPSMTVEMGVTNSDGSSTQAVRTWTINSTTRVWFAEKSSVLESYGLGSGTAQYFYIKVTNAGKWWIDEMQLEANTIGSIPEVFVRTSGASASNQSDRSLLTQRKVCSSCSERILSKSERFGRTDESPIDEPVETWAQEI